MAKLVKIEENGELLGFAIRELRSVFGYEYLTDEMGNDFWWCSFKYSHRFLFTTEADAVNRWEDYKRMKNKKIKVTVVRTLK